MIFRIVLVESDMKTKPLNRYLAVITSLLVVMSCTSQTDQNDFSFIVFSDQRSHATEEYHLKEYTLGGLQAIKNVGTRSASRRKANECIRKITWQPKCLNYV